MKSFNLIISIFIMPNLCWGQFCSQGNGLAQQWRQQNLWQEEIVTPSMLNPHLQFQTFRDEDDQIYIAPFDVKGSYQAKMSLDIKSIYTQKQFLDFCTDDTRYGTLLTSARLDQDNQNQYRVPLTYLPSSGSSKLSPYVQQGFVLDTNGLGVKVILRENSIVKRNSSWSNINLDVELDLSKRITREIKKQLSDSMDGSVTLVLDQMDDLVCDILKGDAELRFFQTGMIMNPKVEMKREIRVNDLLDLYSLLKENKPTAASKEKRFFDAGVLWLTREQTKAGSSLDDQDKAFHVLTQLLDEQSALVKKEISDQEMSCLAENESEYLKRSYNASVSVVIKTQTLNQEVMGL